MTGRLGTEKDGFELRCRLEGDTLRGRIGGALMGKDLEIDITETGVTGRVGGRNGFDVNLELQSGELVGNVGADTLRLRGVDRVTGRIGEGFAGADIAAQQRGHRLTGIVGGTLGRPFELNLGDAPGWIGALVAAVTYYAFERHNANA